MRFSNRDAYSRLAARHRKLLAKTAMLADAAGRDDLVRRSCEVADDADRRLERACLDEIDIPEMEVSALQKMVTALEMIVSIHETTSQIRDQLRKMAGDAAPRPTPVH